MSLPRTSLRTLVVFSAAAVLVACSDVEVPEAPAAAPRLVEKHGVVFGEVWDGPERSRYSQANEEVIIRDFFDDRRGGFFVDVGSADPIVDSTTYYLEKHLGWSGIAVDALSEYASAYAKERPGTRFRSYIVTDHAGAQEKFYRARAANLSSTDPDREWRGRKVETETLEVPTITLDVLLADEGVERIDFLSLDIEGHEVTALAAFDIARFQPELVCVEVAPDNREAVSAWFAERGYERIERYARFDHVNWYFTPAGRRGQTGGS